MKIKSVRYPLLPLVLIALIASLLWTYLSIQSKPSEKQGAAELVILPEYHIVSGKDLIVWPLGTELEQGRASYFYAAKPQINITPIINLSHLNQGFLNGSLRAKVVIQAVNDKAQIYWQHILKETREESFVLSVDEEGVTKQLSYRAKRISLDVISAQQQITQISNELMFQTGIFQLVVNTYIQVKGSVNGSEVEKSLVQTLPITLEQVSFSVPKSQELASSISFSEKMVSKNRQQRIMELIQDNPLQFAVSTLLLLYFLLLFLTGRRNTPKAAAEHKRYKEWITEGSVETKENLQINIFSLEGLVDLAIDMDKRVIYDSGRSRYYVLTEDIVYVYDPEKLRGVMNNRQQLGKLLLERDLLKSEQLEMGLYYQHKIGSRLGESLIALGFIDEITLYSTLAAQQKMDYYELEPDLEGLNIDWLSKMSIEKARAFMVLPLGVRADGRHVIACSEASREGIKEALKEIFGREIYIVSARPSAIYEILEKIDAKEKQKVSITEMNKDKKVPYERLTMKEREHFITSYYRGKIEQELLLKAAGFIDSVLIAQIPEKENIINWSIHKHLLDGITANLMKGLHKAVDALDWKTRQEKQLPSLSEVLLKANYLSEDTVEWINRELVLQESPLEQLLLNNYLASAETIQKASFLLHLIENIMTKENDAS